LIRSHLDNPFVSGAPDLDTLGKVLNSADSILGRNDDVCQLLIHPMVDPCALAAAWAAIEALPPSSRGLQAATLGEIIMSSSR
jgi:hypothetical protein